MTTRKHFTARRPKHVSLVRKFTKHVEGMLTSTTTALTKLARAYNKGARRPSYHAGARRRRAA